MLLLPVPPTWPASAALSEVNEKLFQDPLYEADSEPLICKLCEA
jgi:hypothetical protein